MKDILPINGNPYNKPRINIVYHGTEIISNLGPKLWDLVSSNLKQVSEIDKFKKAIKQWKPQDCPCRLCNFFVQNVGFLEKIT